MGAAPEGVSSVNEAGHDIAQGPTGLDPVVRLDLAQDSSEEDQPTHGLNAPDSVDNGWTLVDGTQSGVVQGHRADQSSGRMEIDGVEGTAVRAMRAMDCALGESSEDLERAIEQCSTIGTNATVSADAGWALVDGTRSDVVRGQGLDYDSGRMEIDGAAGAAVQAMRDMDCALKESSEDRARAIEEALSMMDKFEVC